jgi:putative oxidoreductase
MPTARDLDLTGWGAALLRVSLGVMFLAHSVVLKLLTYGLPGTAAFFEGVGLPGWLAYVTFACEAAGGALLVLGVQARWVALALSPFLLGALFTVHLPNGWVFTSTGGGWEYPLYLLVLCVAQALLGDGAFALSPSRPLGVLFGRADWQPAAR